MNPASADPGKQTQVQLAVARDAQAAGPEPGAPPSKGGGQQLAPGVRNKMEASFGADF